MHKIYPIVMQKVIAYLSASEGRFPQPHNASHLNIALPPLLLSGYLEGRKLISLNRVMSLALSSVAASDGSRGSSLLAGKW